MSDLITHYRQLVGIAKGWALKNLPGWNDETHRDLLARHGAAMIDGRVSARSMNIAGLGAVLDDYQRRGWPRNSRFSNEGKTRQVPPRIAVMVRLWGKLGQTGKVNKPTRPALLAFCERQIGRPVPDLDSLTTVEGQTVIESLKAWLGRD